MTEVFSFSPSWASAPGETIADLLKERNLTQADLAERTGYSKKHVNDLVRGRASISFEAALKLEAVLGSSADFWMRREVQFREALARKQVYEEHAKSADWLKMLPLSDMIRNRWIEKFHDKGQQVEECLKFFRVASVPAWKTTYSEMLGAFRAATTANVSGAAAAAWIQQGESQADLTPTSPYDASKLKQLVPALRELTLETDPQVFVPQLRDLAASAGVAVVFLPTPKGCPAYGATKWLNPNKALVLLSNRYKTHDVLWFTFFHEICHILRHSKKITVIEGAKSLNSVLESEADAFAANVLIPPQFAELLPEIPRTLESIVDFANMVGVAPGIVLGRMQTDDLIPWSRFSRLKVRYTLE